MILSGPEDEGECFSLAVKPQNGSPSASEVVFHAVTIFRLGMVFLLHPNFLHKEPIISTG